MAAIRPTSCPFKNLQGNCNFPLAGICSLANFYMAKKFGRKAATTRLSPLLSQPLRKSEWSEHFHLKDPEDEGEPEEELAAVEHPEETVEDEDDANSSDADVECPLRRKKL